MKRNLIILILLLNISLVLGATTSIVEFNYDFNKTSESDPLMHYTDSILLTVNTPYETECYYTKVNGPDPSNPFEKNYGTKHEKIIEGLSDGLHKYYIKCGTNISNPIMETSFKTKDTISASIEISKTTPLNAGTYNIQLTTSTQVLGEPILEYSFDGMSYSPLPLEGSGTYWTGHLIVEKNVGETIGSFRFRATDLNGREGTKINNDKVFIVDTIAPEVIQTIDATGYKGEIELLWHLEEEAEEFIIYRSENEGVEFTDEFKTVNRPEYLDTAVTNGATYYYRIVAVDEAGNKGQFSREIYATALLYNNTPKAGGLNPSLIGKVDNFITEIRLTTEDINSIRESFNSKDEKEKKLFEELALTKEFDNAISEINSLKKDVERYKEQDLSENELEKKLNSGKVKLDIIKKSVPESLTIVDENEVNRALTEDKITEVILEYGQEFLTDQQTKSAISLTKKLIKDEEIKVTSSLYNVNIIYLDGTKKEITLIRDLVAASLERSEDTRFFLSIPKEIAETTNDIDVRRLNYEIIKEDLLVAFDADISELVYTLNKHTDVSKLNDIKIVPVREKLLQESSSMITGYSIFDASSFNYGNIGYIALGIALLLLAAYFIYIKKKGSENKGIEKRIKEAREYKKEKNHKKLDKAYKEIKEEYKNLPQKKKEKYYSKIKKLHEK